MFEKRNIIPFFFFLDFVNYLPKFCVMAIAKL